MSDQHSKATIISMAVIASAVATLLHEGVGHGVTAWLRGDIPTELTSNHLSRCGRDCWVDAGGTLVNLVVGAGSLLASRSAGDRANILATFCGSLPRSTCSRVLAIPCCRNLRFRRLAAGDPRPTSSDRTAHRHDSFRRLACMCWETAARRLCATLSALNRSTYNTVGDVSRYYAACLFSCAAGALDPLGLKLLFVATIRRIRRIFRPDVGRQLAAHPL